MKLVALVVDDSQLMRSMVKHHLKLTGLADFEFVEAANGAEGLERFEAGGIDIIFADWNMPFMNGLELMRQVRASSRGSGIPLVMITSLQTKDRMHQALGSGIVDGYITKPFTAAQLKSQVEPLVKALADSTGERLTASPN
jgi:two-component system chemotaxis response regulator CheY